MPRMRKRKGDDVDHVRALPEHFENADPALDVHDAAQAVFSRLARGIALPGDDGAAAQAAVELATFFAASAKVLRARRVFSEEDRARVARVVRLSVDAFKAVEGDVVAMLTHRIDVAAEALRERAEGCETPDAAAASLLGWLFSSPSWRPVLARIETERRALAAAIDARARVGQSGTARVSRVAADAAVAAFFRKAGLNAPGADRIANVRSEARKRSRLR